VTDPQPNADGTWTIMVMINGKLTEQRVNLEWLADHYESWEHQVDEDRESQHNNDIANEDRR
jgi:hypothetical protein